MNQVLFVPRLLSFLTQPGFLYRAVAVGLRAAVALAILLGLVTALDIIKLTLNLPAAESLGGIFLLLFYSVALYIVAHFSIQRAKMIDGLPAGPYPMLTAAPLLSRLAGEVYAGFVMPLATGSALFTWFTHQGVGRVLGAAAEWLPLTADASFVSGIKLLVIGSLQGLAVLAVFYLLADLLALVLDRVGASESRRKAA